jgi:uncharacterized protein YbjT (DUF2867 family)
MSSEPAGLSSIASSVATIIGATGLVGRECVRQALNRYDSVIALVRRPSLPQHPRLIQRQIDFERIRSIEIAAGAHVYCALGTTIKAAGSEAAFRRVDFDYPRMLAERAAAAGEARFALVSSVGASSKSGTFYLRVKGELEDAVRGMPLAAVHIFEPSLLLGDRAERRIGEKIGVPLSRAIGVLLMGPLRKYRAIPAATVAAGMVAAMQEDTRGTSVYHYDEIVRLAAVNQ